MNQDSIKSKKNTPKFYFLIVGLTIGVLIVFSSIYLYLNNSNYLISIIIGMPITIYTCVNLFIFYKKAPDLLVTKEFIQIDKNIHLFKDVINIDLLNGLTFEFKNNSTEYISEETNNENYTFKFEDAFYGNLNDIKLFIDQVIINKQNFKEIDCQLLKNLPIIENNSRKYMGFDIDKFVIYILTQIIILIGILLIGKTYSKITFIIFILANFVLLIRQMFYFFKIVDDYFVAYSPFLPRIRKIYKMSDIKHFEIVEIEFGKKITINAIKVTLNNYKIEFFRAGLIPDYVLSQLFDDLKASGKSTKNNVV